MFPLSERRILDMMLLCHLLCLFLLIRLSTYIDNLYMCIYTHPGTTKRRMRKTKTRGVRVRSDVSNAWAWDLGKDPGASFLIESPCRRESLIV